MAESRKYYYMRLTENFLDSDAVLALESLPDGYLYSNILLKMYTKSLRGEGRLMLNDRIPYSSELLAKVTRHNVGVVEKALTFFLELGLIEVLDSGAIYMLDIQNFIGTSSTEADRKRAYRARIDAEKGDNPLEDKCPDKSLDKSPPEIESKKDIEREDKTDKPSRSRFVPPSVDEVSAYCQERGNSIDPEYFVDFYTSNGWIQGKGKPITDWKACVRTWERRDKVNQVSTQEAQKPKTRIERQTIFGEPTDVEVLLRD